MKFQSPGCDAMGAGGGMNLFGDDDEDEKPYEQCCHEWHACNQICGITKKECDDGYTKCSEKKCSTAEDSEYCQEQAQQNMMMINLSGCKSFEVVQSQACACITKYGNRHEKQREDALKAFYKLYAPDGMKKVPDLLKKADTTPKMAKLLYKLIQKYPASIEMVEDPQTKMYRQMFGAAGMGGMGGMGGGDPYGGGDDEDMFDDLDDLGEFEGGGSGRPEDVYDDFDVDEGLGSYGDEEEPDDPPPPKKKRTTEKMKMKKDPPPPPPQEDEFDQYQEL